jgi:hypothetical protein
LPHVTRHSGCRIDYGTTVWYVPRALSSCDVLGVYPCNIFSYPDTHRILRSWLVRHSSCYGSRIINLQNVEQDDEICEVCEIEVDIERNRRRGSV